MTNVYTLKVYPQGQGTAVYRVIKISGHESLDKLCRVILDAFGFTCDHLYEFCMDNRMYSDFSYQSYPEFAGQKSTRVKLNSLHLEQGQKFLFHYDFGDDWGFTIRVQAIEELEEKIKPQLLKSKGTLEQYPDWDDWEEDEEDDDKV